jgi:hypothetical protein
MGTQPEGGVMHRKVIFGTAAVQSELAACQLQNRCGSQGVLLSTVLLLQSCNLLAVTHDVVAH